MYKHTSWLPAEFNDFFDTPNFARNRSVAPAMNVVEGETKYEMLLAVPGMQKGDFDINLNADGELTIKIEKPKAEESQQVRYLRREFSPANYSQTYVLPDDVDRQNISARVADGILTVELPKQQKTQNDVVRNIEIM